MVTKNCTNAPGRTKVHHTACLPRHPISPTLVLKAGIYHVTSQRRQIPVRADAEAEDCAAGPHPGAEKVDHRKDRDRPVARDRGTAAAYSTITGPFRAPTFFIKKTSGTTAKKITPTARTRPRTPASWRHVVSNCGVASPASSATRRTSVWVNCSRSLSFAPAVGMGSPILSKTWPART